MSDIPRGTVTFLFSDIEGSTKLWEHNPEAMALALARHNALLQEAIEQHDGYVFKTVGDAVCAAFHTAATSLAAAVAAQRALAREQWPTSAYIKVRMALHTGAAEIHNKDYFGQPLNRVARLVAAGHGGQVLLSLATQELVRDRLPAGMSLRDMGERRLKDLIRPERVYQLVASGLPADFPPLRTLDTRAHNLPIQSTSFVGRDRDMHEVKALLRSARLVTLTGSGGAGKTRLALQIGADRSDDFADGVWFVELAPLTDPRLVPQTVATVLAIKEQPAMALTDTLTLELKNRELLLLLDNCEHLVEASADLCQALLAACANVRILATSRESLRVPGESAYRVPSLATPEPKSSSNVEALTEYAAVRLFIDRALAVKSSFKVNNANAPAVASICRHLDGIPLAIELAAARLRSMSVDEVNERLDQRFRLLIDGSRTALPRQQTLRALIDWSYDLLHGPERVLLRRLSVFSGGWTLEAAEAVCGGAGVDTDAVLNLLASLVDKSMVVAEERNGATRYRLLETVRQYAWHQLRQTDEEDICRERHVAFLVAIAEKAEPELKGAHQQAWLERLEADHDNLRSALTWSATARRDAERGLRLASALWRFWLMRGDVDEGRRFLSAQLAAVHGGQATHRAKALHAAGVMAWQQGDYSAASARLEESLALRRELRDRTAIAETLTNLGIVAHVQCNIRLAREYYEEALSIRRELGDRWGIAVSLENLGTNAYDRGDYVSARVLLEESLTISRALGAQWQTGFSLGDLGAIALEQCDYRGALALYQDSLKIRRELGDQWGIALAIEGIANLASLLNEPCRAARLWGRAERLREEIGVPLTPIGHLRYDRQVASARTRMGHDMSFDSAWQEGRAMTLERAVEYALTKPDT